jgi:large subunit ribosomal protein L6
MSRIGKSPVTIPGGVEVKVNGSTVVVKGPMGSLERTFDPSISIELTGGEVLFTRSSDDPGTRALHGLSRALLANMVEGVTDGFKKELQMVGVGYRAALNGKRLDLQVGFSHPVHMDAPDGVTFEVPEPTKIIITGIDKQKVGQSAANIRSVRPPEPYKGKGIRYVDEKVRRKAGKAGISA